MKKALTPKQSILLREALRRYTQFHASKKLKDVCTGLGTATEYKPVFDAGYMTYANGPNPGYLTWWKLTDKGLKIVQKWVDEGYSHEKLPYYPDVIDEDES